MAPLPEPTQGCLPMEVPSQHEEGTVLCLRAQVRMTLTEALQAVLGNNADHANRTCIDTCPNQCFK